MLDARLCIHCGERTYLRSGTWDSWNAIAEMFLPHLCEGIRQDNQAQGDAWAEVFVPIWTATLKDMEGRYDG